MSRVHLFISRVHLCISRVRLVMSRIHVLISFVHLFISGVRLVMSRHQLCVSGILSFMGRVRFSVPSGPGSFEMTGDVRPSSHQRCPFIYRLCPSSHHLVIIYSTVSTYSSVVSFKSQFVSLE